MAGRSLPRTATVIYATKLLYIHYSAHILASRIKLLLISIYIVRTESPY